MRKKLQHSMMFFHDQDPKKIIFLFSGLFLISMLVTLLILLSGHDRLSVEQDEQNVYSSVKKLILEDFLLPPLKKETIQDAYIFRERLSSWDEEQVNRYWIPLNKIVLDNIIKENDRIIEELFRDIP